MKLHKLLFVMQRYFMQLYFVSLYLSDRKKTGTKFSKLGCTPPDASLAHVLVLPGGTSRGNQLYSVFPSFWRILAPALPMPLPAISNLVKKPI